MIEGSIIAQVTNDIEKGWKDMHYLLEKISNSGTLKPVLRFPFVSRGRKGLRMKLTFLVSQASANFCDSPLVSRQKLKLLRQHFADRPFLFHSAKPFSSIAIRKKVKFDEARCLFSTFLRLEGDHHCACAQKWCHFSYFPRPFKQKKTKNLQPKMIKRTSKGGVQFL